MFETVTLVSRPIPGQAYSLLNNGAFTVVPEELSFSWHVVTDEVRDQAQIYLNSLIAGVNSPSWVLFMEAVSGTANEIYGELRAQHVVGDVLRVLAQSDAYREHVSNVLALSEVVGAAYFQRSFGQDYQVKKGAAFVACILFLSLFTGTERFPAELEGYLKFIPVINRMLVELNLPAVGDTSDDGRALADKVICSAEESDKARMLKWLTIAGYSDEALTAAAGMTSAELKALYPNIAKYGPAGERIQRLQTRRMELPRERYITFAGMPISYLDLTMWSLKVRPAAEDQDECDYLRYMVGRDFAVKPSPKTQKNGAGELILNAVATMHLLDEPDSLFEAHIEYLIRYMGRE